MIQDITIHFDEATETLLSAYTIAHHISRSAFIKQTVPEKLADWVDVQAADQKWKKDRFKTMSWPETVQGLGL
ncbi:hypothetical protein N692_07410 [Lactiplantibacillus plantarum EGD-AQ4]|nr:hypothetical protein N692_07410 [Lactiplantibacillus plantarum EGD-AQ4]